MNKFDYKNLTPFKWFVLENFPFIEADFDALTEWQLFCKLGKEMNKIINSENTLGTQVENVTDAFIELQKFVNNYFENLDVQEEINNKLNEMTEDGTLTNLIKNYIDPFIAKQNERLDSQDATLNGRLDSQDATLNGRLDSQDATLEEINETVTRHTSQIANLVSENNPTEGNTELIDIRVAENGYIYKSAGDSVRNQIKDVKQLEDIKFKSLKNSWQKTRITIPSDLFEIGGINSNTGENVESPSIIRTKAYLTFEEIFRYLYITPHTEEQNNLIILTYASDNTYISVHNFKTGIPFQQLTATRKYRLALVDDSKVSDVATTLAKFDFDLVSYIEKTSNIFDIKELNLIKSEYVVNNCLLDNTTGRLTYSSGVNSSIIVPVKPNTLYYDDNPQFYTAFFDINQNLIGSVHYADTALSSPFTTPENAYFMAKTFRTAHIGVSAFISEVSQYYDDTDILISVKNTVHNKPILENDILLNVLKNKVINIFGDSISSTDYVLPYWGDIIVNKTGCIVNNYGISGTTLAHTNDRHLFDYHFTRLDAEKIGYVENDPSTWSTGNCFCERFTKVDNNADAIVIMGGTNDYDVPVGDWNSTDTATFYGALNKLLDGISKNMAGKKIIVCTPIQGANDYQNNVIDAVATLKQKTSSQTLSLQLRAEAIKQKCKQYGIRCLDLYNTSGINGIDTNHIYYRTDDNLHPSSYGQVRLATLIQNELEKLFK